jgi:hypothetical protein
LLFAVGLVIWLGGQTAQRRTAPEAEQQRLRQVAVQPVREYIQSCLDVTTSTALELLGKQGGVLYQHQGGLTEDVQPADLGSRFVVFDELNVSYAILRPAQDLGQLSIAQPPDYPYPNFPYIFKNGDPKTGEVVLKRTEGYFGDYQLAPLFKPGKESIQEQLESFISFNLPQCPDWNTFAQLHGLKIEAAEANATVLIAENLTQIETERFFTVLVDWPVQITDQTTGGNTTIVDFSLSYPVHLAKFYLFVQTMLINEVSNSTYDPRSASSPATPVAVIEAYTNPEDLGGDDIIVVQDTASQLRGKPLEFRLLRKNRFPALVWLNQTSLSQKMFIPAQMCDISSPNIQLQGSMLTVQHGDTWVQQLQAIDPDEDVVTFRTNPPAPVRMSGPSGFDFHLFVYASDGGKVEDYQDLEIEQDNCPVQ